MKSLKPSTAVELSSNRKTGPISATYAAIDTCPKSCPFLNAGCYAQSGHCAFTLGRLNKDARIGGFSALEIAKHEADQIDRLSGYYPLRLHVVGDCATDESAKVIAAAFRRYHRRHQRVAWTYTHAWRDVSRKSWGTISVLASCETLNEAREAMKRGYAAAVVFPSRESMLASLKDWRKEKLAIQPCLEQHNGTKCSECRMCWYDKALLRQGTIIGFIPHGSGAKAVAREIIRKGNAS